MNIFISQPMNGLTDDEIKKKRQEIVKSIAENTPSEINVIDSFMENAPHDASPVWFLGKSIEYLSKADMAYFALGWEKARGCIIEHAICSLYHIPIVEEQNNG